MFENVICHLRSPGVFLTDLLLARKLSGPAPKAGCSTLLPMVYAVCGTTETGLTVCIYPVQLAQLFIPTHIGAQF